MDDDMHFEVKNARILVAITFHYNADRLKYLAQVLRALSQFDVEALSIKIFTNTDVAAELNVLRRLGIQYPTFDQFDLEIRRFLRHPFELTWSHKEMITTEFGENTSGTFTHFIYLEDDIGLSFRNFEYFCKYRSVLAKSGLVPSFVRVEYSSISNGFVNTDNGTALHLEQHPRLDLGDLSFIVMPNPFCACFILDRALAAEHMRSRSFHVDESAAVIGWAIRERAAMGQCFENIPVPFGSRYVVPICKKSKVTPSYAWVSHIANNYADDETTPFAKIRMEDLFL